MAQTVMAQTKERHSIRAVAVILGALTLAGTAVVPAQATEQAGGPSVRTVTRCSDFGGMGDMKVCVSTGPREPTIAWFDNMSGVTHFGAILQITNTSGSYRSQDPPYTAHAHSIKGMQRFGLANDCYYGSVSLNGGHGFYRTREAACV
ncbi:hypothetical protein ACH4SP_04875 [Streptomyces sp. NPDC021093]|uniref:hypothetical protein n=1 Tax=Streptomyces sp. NPDC021093 TaxID=3365112 RepID=UPI003798CF72